MSNATCDIFPILWEFSSFLALRFASSCRSFTLGSIMCGERTRRIISSCRTEQCKWFPLGMAETKFRECSFDLHPECRSTTAQRWGTQRPIWRNYSAQMSFAQSFTLFAHSSSASAGTSRRWWRTWSSTSRRSTALRRSGWPPTWRLRPLYRGSCAGLCDATLT